MGLDGRSAVRDGVHNEAPWIQWLKKHRIFVRNLLLVLCIAYPFAGMFFGLDLGDTGYHLFAFENLASNPEKINYTTYLTTVVGYFWGRLFGGFGLLAFNFLEVLLEWTIIWLVYRTFKDILGEVTVLAGSLIAVMAADAYLNIFNYHQFNAFLLVVLLCLEYSAISEDRLKFSFIAGMMYPVIVFARVGSVIAVVTWFLYLYDTVMNHGSFRRLGKQLLVFIAGCAVSAVLVIGALQLTGTLGHFYDNVIRLRNIASDSSTSYGFGNLLEMLIMDNLKVMASGAIYAASVLVLICAFNMLYAKQEKRSGKIMTVLAACFIGGISIYQMGFAWNVNPAENWPQMTSGQRFVIGVMYVAAFGAYMLNAFSHDLASRKRTLLVLSGYILVILTIAGSNTGTKHVILGMWLIAPVFVWAVRKIFFSLQTEAWLSVAFRRIGLPMDKKTLLSAFLVAACMFLLKYGHMLYYTFNYDSVDRTKLTATVGAWNVRGIFTTEREAEALRGVLQAIGENDGGEPLMVYGNSLLFYYLTGKESYGAAWVTPATYAFERYQADLELAKEKYGDTLPIVIYCKTNYAYGFEEEKLEENLQLEKSIWYSGKKEYFVNFLQAGNYGTIFENDYYKVLMPWRGDGNPDTLWWSIMG